MCHKEDWLGKDSVPLSHATPCFLEDVSGMLFLGIILVFLEELPLVQRDAGLLEERHTPFLAEICREAAESSR